MDIGMPELLIVLVVVLLLFGPGRIVKLSREIGEGIRHFRQGLESSSEEDEQEKE
jgi:sec-independent protein translocase protein TatA